MKAAIRDRYGPPHVVQVRDVDVPVPKDDEVLVRVHAASVNRADLDALYALRADGVYAALGGDSAAWFAQALLQGPALSLATHRDMGLMLHWKPFAVADVEALKELVAAGQVRPAIDRRFPLSDRRSPPLRRRGHARGKVVVTM